MAGGLAVPEARSRSHVHAGIAPVSISALLIAASITIGSAPTAVAGGLVIEVTTTEDELLDDGDCSLREAILAANTNAPVDNCGAGVSGADFIMLQPLTYTLSIAGRGEDSALTGDLDLLEGMVLSTAGLGTLGWATIDAGGLDRIFDVHAGADRWSLRDVELIGGDPGDGDGGGIRVADRICLDGLPAPGGAVENVTLRDNRAERGGALYLGSCHHPWLRFLSIVRNDAASHGGGIAVAPGSNLVLGISTVSGNSAGVAGGGLWHGGTAGQFHLGHVTLAENVAPDGAAAWGPGVVLDDTLVARNVGPACGPEPAGYSGGVSDDDSCGGGATTDAGIQPLTTSGLHYIHSPEPNSPAIDAAGPAEPWCHAESSADQVATEWPLDGDGDGLAWCDAGAVEAPAVEPDHVRIQLTTTEDEVNADGDCSLREAVLAANTNAPVDACPAGRPLTNLAVNADEIVIPAGTYALSIGGVGEDAATTGDLDITEEVRIAGTGGPVIDAAGIDRVFDILPGVSADLSGLSLIGGDAGAEDGGGIRLGDSACLPDGNLQHGTTLDQVLLEGNAAARGGGVHVGDCVYLTVYRSSVVGNSAGMGGGASVILGAQFTAIQSTFSGNVARVAGGAVWGALGGAVPGVALEYATIAENHAPEGAAVWVLGDARQWTSTYVVMGGNSGPACMGFANLSWSVTDDASCGGAEVVDDTGLGPAERVGRLVVHIPDPGAPPIDISNESPCGPPYTPTDQIGAVRPQDGNGDGVAACDAGAIEVATAAVPQLPDTALPVPSR
jgi:CSLREA domain-containing protein